MIIFVATCFRTNGFKFNLFWFIHFLYDLIAVTKKQDKSSKGMRAQERKNQTKQAK